MNHNPDGSSDLDLVVLAHLRGYPEELRRFSNLMKQAHPNGRAAAKFFLSRPVAEGSFVAELCRLVHAGEDIATVVEVAEVLHLSPARVLELAPAPGFPRPLSGVGRHMLWRRGDIVAFHHAGSDPTRRAT
jgi:hypothetical protein